MSIGVSATQTPTDILRQADRAVYMAKAGGRDRMVMVCDNEEPPQAQPTDAPPRIPRRVEPSRKTRPTSRTKKKAV